VGTPVHPEDLIGFAIMHEVRGLLTPARWHLELARSTGHTSVEAAIRAIDKAVEFAETVLCARPGAECDLAETVISALATLPPNDAQIDVDVELGARVAIPQAVLERVVANVVTNSVQAMGSRPGCVSIHSFPWNGSWRLQLTDTGPGMSQPSLAPSRGRGLQICLFLMEQSGGRLLIDQRPGHGTCVTLDLPVMAAQQAA
jgi:signal transduction histidine kinase